MAIEDSKRWHWALIGLALGLAISYLQIAVGGDALTTGARAATLSPAKFEEYLREQPVQGYSKIRNVVVYPANGDLVQVGMELFRPLRPEDPRRAKLHVSSTDPRACEYVPAWLNAKTPYAPVSDPSQTVSVRISLEDRSVEINHADTRFRPTATGAAFSGWEGKGEGGSDPGERSSVSLPIRRADYQITVRVAGSTDNSGVTEFAGKFNGQPLGRFERISSVRFRTRIPAAGFVNGPLQILEFTKPGGTPVLLREIELVDTRYTVLNYLQTAHARNPSITFRYAWWAGKVARMSIWGVGGLVLIGGVWPTLLGLLSGAGFGRVRAVSDNYDLSRFKGDRAATAAAKGGAADPQRARELEQALETAVQAVAAELASAPQSKATPAAEVIPVLARADASKGPQVSEPQLHFTGEFYPVARSDSSSRSKKE